MELIRCPGCYMMIDIDKVEVETPADDVVVGCGLAEGDFGECYECVGENKPDECRDIRNCLSYTKTTFKELQDHGN